MRIFGTHGISQWLTGRSGKVNERSTVDADSQRQDSPQYEGQQNQKEDTQKENTASFEEVRKQIDKFAEDSALKANGLHAEILTSESLENGDRENEPTPGGAGQQPGLKVVVKDREGKILRQLTGDEFLKLRDSQAPKTSNVGKLIDRKY